MEQAYKEATRDKTVQVMARTLKSWSIELERQKIKAQKSTNELRKVKNMNVLQFLKWRKK